MKVDEAITKAIHYSIARAYTALQQQTPTDGHLLIADRIENIDYRIKSMYFISGRSPEFKNHDLGVAVAGGDDRPNWLRPRPREIASTANTPRANLEPRISK